ncbi:MAG: hypothetical protein ACTSU2_15925 [Promethearchaeota archaeon]
MTIASEEFKKKAIEWLKGKNIPEKILDQVWNIMKDEELTKEQVQYFVDEVYISFQKALVSPGEPVGTVAAQSIGEPGTQMSIAGNEPIIYKIGNRINIEPIEQFVERLIESADVADLFTIYPDTIVYNIPKNIGIYVPSLNNDEKIHWKRLRQVSKHLPKEKLIHIQTESGRSIVATPYHSFVTRKNNNIVTIKGKDLKINDRIPVVKRLPINKVIKQLNSSEIISEQIYNHLVDGTVSYHENYVDVGINFGIENNSRLALKQLLIDSGVYNTPTPIISGDINLTNSLGKVMGKYIARIKNNNSLKLGHNSEFHGKRDNSNDTKDTKAAKDTSLYLTAKLLLADFTGDGMTFSTIPSWVLGAPRKFIIGFLNEYIIRKAEFDKEKNVLNIYAESKNIMDTLALLLNRFSIFSTKHYRNVENNRTEYYLNVRSKDLKSLIKLINFKTNGTYYAEIAENEYRNTEIIPNFGNVLELIMKELNIPQSSPLGKIIINATKKQAIRKDVLKTILNDIESLARNLSKLAALSKYLKKIKNACSAHVVWDRISELEFIEPPTKYVYDLAVNGLETFTTMDGIITHNTLRTFHFAGVQEFSVTQGLPRLIEIVDARRNPSTPIMYIYLEKPYSEDKEKAREIHHKIEQIRIENIASDIELDLTEYAINIYFDPELLEDKGLDLNEISKKLKKFKKKGNIDVNEDEYMISVAPGIEDIQKLQKMREKIENVLISGLKGVSRGIIYKEPKTREWMIQTEGTNLEEVLKLKGVDKVRTISNHIHEVERIFGIEAARELIIREAEGVLEDQGLDVDHRHLLAMADLMCHTGQILQIGRHGISGVKESILARAAFEVTIKQLINASISGEEEKLMGIPENVIVGQLVPTIGTGAVHLTLNLEKYSERLNKLAKGEDEDEDDEEED